QTSNSNIEYFFERTRFTHPAKPAVYAVALAQDDLTDQAPFTATVTKAVTVRRQRGDFGAHTKIFIKPLVLSNGRSQIADLVKLLAGHAGPGVPNAEFFHPSDPFGHQLDYL